jgi:P27 family predicted phage terminase small subunit
MLDLSQFSQYVPKPTQTAAPRLPAASTSIACPGVLAGEAKKEWTRITKELKRLGFLDQVDRALLAMYCIAWAEWLESLALIRVDGAGTPQNQTPGKWLKSCAEKRLMQLASELGLSPNARARIQKAIGDKPSDFPQIPTRPSFN